MSRKDVVATIILIVTILMGVLLNAENQKIICEFIKAYQSISAAIIGSIIASTITVAGWGCTYYFNNKVQDQRLKNDITNTTYLSSDNL